MEARLYAAIDGYKLKNLDFKEINPKRFFPKTTRFDRYDFRHPRFKIERRNGVKCLIVTMDNLTVDPVCDCFDATIEAVWRLGNGFIEYVYGVAANESAGEISIDSAIRLGLATSAPVSASYTFRGLTQKRKGVLIPGKSGEIRIASGQCVDTCIPKSAVKSVTIGL